MQKEKSRHEEAFEEFARRAKNKLGESIQRLMLYGSVARGEEGEKSDVDVLLVVKYKDEEIKEEIISIAYDVLMESGVYISPKILSREEYQRLKSSKSHFLRTAEGEGELVRV